MNLIFSNSGEAIVINKEYTKGIVLRGYNKKISQNLIL